MRLHRNTTRLCRAVRARCVAGGLAALATLPAACAAPAASANYAARAAAADAAARQAVRDERTLDAASIPRNTLSVSPLAVLSADTSYSSIGYGVAALLVNDLSHSAKLTLVERLRIDAVLRELDLAQSGRVDTNTAPRVGKLVGAHQVIVGSIDLRKRGNLHLQSYVANTSTAKVGSALDGSAPLDQIFDAEKSLAFRLFDALGVTLTPAERRAVEPQETRSLVAFLEFSRGSRAEAFSDFGGAQTHYAEAVRLDPSFQAARARLNVLQLPVVSVANPTDFLLRAAAMSNDLINRPAPVTIGTGADAPAASRAQLVTFTIVVRTP
jgi:hypothetical protein